MLTRTGHRLRWLVVWLFLAVWAVSLIFDLGAGLGNVLLVLAVVVLLYELLAVDRPAA